MVVIYIILLIVSLTLIFVVALTARVISFTQEHKILLNILQPSVNPNPQPHYSNTLNNSSQFPGISRQLLQVPYNISQVPLGPPQHNFVNFHDSVSI